MITPCANTTDTITARITCRSSCATNTIGTVGVSTVIAFVVSNIMCISVFTFINNISFTFAGK